MIKVLKVNSFDNYVLNCTFSNGEIKNINILPLIENHKSINGVQNLLKTEIFEKAEVGTLGQIFWKDLVEIQNNGKTNTWDYDISGEYAYMLAN